jgi:anti-anti-sigma factor
VARIEGLEQQLQTTSIDGILVLAVRGDIHMLTAPLLREALHDSLSKVQRALFIDLTQVESLASSGMAALIVAGQEAGKSTQLAVIVGPSTRTPLHTIGLDTVLSLYSTLDDALTAFQSN